MLRRTLLQAAVATGALLKTSVSLAAEYQEGKDYFVLEKRIPDATGTFVKVWSYACPFCWKFDRAVDPRILPFAQNRCDLIYQHLPVETKGDFGRVAAEFLVWCQMLDRQEGLDVLDKNTFVNRAKAAWYEAYHKKKRRWKDGQNAFIQTALDATGLRAQDFATVRNSAEVQNMANAWARYSYDIAKVQGIPAYVVHGRYLIATNQIRSVRHMKDLIRYLASKES